MLGFLLRVWLRLLLFALGRMMVGGPGRPRPSAPLNPPPGPPRRSVPPFDRSDAVDVPFTEIPPPSGPAKGAAGGS